MAARTRSRSTIRAPSRERPNKLMKSAPGSRSSSPSVHNRRVAKLDMYMSKSMKRNSCISFKQSMEPSYNPVSTRDIKRWDGNRRTTMKWDSVRKDPEIWFPNGDCLVHFYEQGGSKRGASLRVFYSDVQISNCGPLIETFYSRESLAAQNTTPTDSDRSVEDPDYFNEPSSPAQHEFYIPAPSHYTREEAFNYHMTTRNFFAWMYERPLVGERLGRSLISLQERMYEYRPNEEECHDDTLKYIDDQGYTDFRHCPDHALALLQYAEHYRLRDLWTDAFAHCTGMNDELDESGELDLVSRASQALIMRSHIEMDVRLERAGRSLSNFLEDDLSGAYLGLGKDAALHLERFRSFLHTYHVGQHGYWPPIDYFSSTDAFPKSVYQSMYFDFRNLYAYLADTSSGTAIQDNRPVDGGICVFQNVSAFDKRNKYASLPHPLPLVPKVPVSLNTRKSLFSIFGNTQAKHDRRTGACSALLVATNSIDPKVMSNGLVREYLRFEKIWTLKEDAVVSCADARKVRWILLYAILQTIIGVTQVPNEVRDTEGVTYPLCCQIGGTPPWPVSKPVVEPIEPESPRPRSLKEQIIELGPDMDNLKPSPLVVNTKTPSPPRRASFVHKISLKSPKPLRTPSIEFLGNTFGDSRPVSPLDRASSRPVSFLEQIPLDFGSPSLPDFALIEPSQPSDPSTPSTSEAGGSAGWSASSSEDGMDHPSAGESDSNYGDEEDEEEPRSSSKSAKTASKSLKPPSTTPKRSPSGASMARSNPEVEQFLRS